MSILSGCVSRPQSSAVGFSRFVDSVEDERLCRPALLGALKEGKRTKKRVPETQLDGNDSMSNHGGLTACKAAPEITCRRTAVGRGLPVVLSSPTLSHVNIAVPQVALM